MTEIEQKALALVNEVNAERDNAMMDIFYRSSSAQEALCRAIEQHEQFKREVSDAVEDYLYCCKSSGHTITVYAPFIDFILPKTVDPLVEALCEVRDSPCIRDTAEIADDLRAALAKRGLEVREIEG